MSSIKSKGWAEVRVEMDSHYYILKRGSNRVCALWSVTEPNQNKKEQKSDEPDIVKI